MPYTDDGEVDDDDLENDSEELDEHDSGESKRWK